MKYICKTRDFPISLSRTLLLVLSGQTRIVNMVKIIPTTHQHVSI